MQLNRNRFYHAPLGRWVNRDPIGYAGGYNLYSYVDLSPVSYVDPFGLISSITGCFKSPAALWACFETGFLSKAKIAANWVGKKGAKNAKKHLKKIGFNAQKGKSGHVKFVHPQTGGHVTVPTCPKIGTAKNMVEQMLKALP